MIDEILSEENIRYTIKRYKKRNCRKYLQNSRSLGISDLHKIVRSRIDKSFVGFTSRVRQGGRELEVPDFFTRIAQLAICNVLRTSVDWAGLAGYVRVVSGERELRHYLRINLREKEKLLVRADVFKYYESIRHGFFLEFLSQTVPDQVVIDVIVNALRITKTGLGFTPGPPLTTFLADKFLILVDCQLEYQSVVRFHDDYFFVGLDTIQCDSFLSILCYNLRRLEFTLNPTKTRYLYDPAPKHIVL